MQVTSTLMRVTRWGVLVVLSSMSVSLLLSKMVWGYWILPPNVVRAPGDNTLAASAIKYDSSSWSETALATAAGSHSSLPIQSAACPEDRLMRGLRVAPPLLPASISAELRPLAMASAGSAPHEQSYSESAKRWQGVALLKTDGADQYVVFGRHTGEVANDRYAYIEDFYAVEGKHITPRQQVRFFFEVAGLEVFSFAVLWIVTTVVGVLVACSLWIVKRAGFAQSDSNAARKVRHG